jgi:hypothetical protein
MTSTHEHIVLRVPGEDQAYRITPERLIIAGFTGRDRQAVDAHLQELREFGVPVPTSTPVFFELDPSLLTTADEISVPGELTSGEVEPVLVVADDTWLLTVGSDHTDRESERVSIRLGKERCPKVIGRDCVPVDGIAAWDAIELESWVDGSSASYQTGMLKDLLPLEDVLTALGDTGTQLRPGDVVFLGTVPVADGTLRFSSRFRGELRDTNWAHTLALDYRIRVSPTGTEAQQ